MDGLARCTRTLFFNDLQKHCKTSARAQRRQKFKPKATKMIWILGGETA
jgi:hypothetical protein